MFSLLRRSLGSPVRRSRECAFAMLPLVHKQAIPSRCGVGYTAPFEELEHLRPIVARFRSEESALQLEATTQFVKLLSTERRPPIEEVIQSGVVPRLVEFKMRKDFPQLQGVRYFTTESASNCYESHEQGLLLPHYIWFVRDIIRSCLDKYSRGIHTASFGKVMSNGLTCYLDDGTDPIIPVGGIGNSGGLYVLLKTLLDFNNQHPKLAVLFFEQLMKVGSYDALHRLLDDLYVKGVTSRVRSMGQLYQAVTNYAPYGTFYRNAHDADLTDWETAISRMRPYKSYDVTVKSLIENIPVKHIREALIDFMNGRLENYGRNDISSCIACMRQGSEHCNQLGTKRRVQKPLTVQDAIWGLNNAFHLVYPFAQSFLNENRHHPALDPAYFSGFWLEIK